MLGIIPHPLPSSLCLYRDFRSGQNERLPRNADNPLIRSAGSTQDQPRRSLLRDVLADDGEITAFHFQNVRASPERWGQGTVCVRIGSDSSNEHGRTFDYSQNAVNIFFFYYLRVPKPSTREAILSNVVLALREERLRKKLSMNALAKGSGLHVSMISLVEREMRNPTLDALLRIAQALDVDLWKLLRDATKKATTRA